MTTEAEKTAEDYANTVHVPWPIANNGIASAVTLMQLKAIQKQAFLAGHAHALTPRKIEADKPETWPPKDDGYLYSKSLLHWEVSKIKNLEQSHFALIQKGNAKLGVYWLPKPLPPTPQREGEN